MSYQYEEIEDKYNIDYLTNLDEIEKLRKKLKITESQIQPALIEDRYNSIAIEGNQLKREEVTYLLETGLSIRGTNIRDHLQAKNYASALDILKQCIMNKEIEVTPEFIKYVHKMMTEGELPTKDCGNYRTEPVHIRTTTYIPPMEFDVPDLMDELCAKFYRPLDGDEIFERITEFKRNFERIHPFVDGNGRTGRFLMNLLFLQNGYGFVTIPPAERDIYFNSIEDNTLNVYLSQKMLESMKQIEEKYHSRPTEKGDVVYDGKKER